MIKKRGRPKGSKKKTEPKQVVKDIFYTKTFEDLMESNERIVICRGSANSGKSWGIIQYLIHLLFSCDGIHILVARKNFTSLRNSTIKDFWEIIDMYGLRSYFEVDNQTATYTTGKSLIHFTSLLDIEKIKSAAYNIIFVEEANSVKHSDFVILQTRLRRPILPEWGELRNRIILALNPVSVTNWIKTKVLDKKLPDMVEFTSTYHDNPFADKDTIEGLENLKYQDQMLYQIYALGNWGVPVGLVFNNWKQVENYADKVNSEGKEICYGIDFGIAAPTAVTKVIADGRDVYVEEVLYKTHVNTNELIDYLKEEIPAEKMSEVKLYCDSAAGDAINILQKAGFYVIPSIKGQGSVLEGIRYMQSCFFMVDSNSTNIVNELSSYCWKKDKNGNILDEPVGMFDHAIDSIRYVLFTRHKSVEAALSF